MFGFRYRGDAWPQGLYKEPRGGWVPLILSESKGVSKRGVGFPSVPLMWFDKFSMSGNRAFDTTADR